MKDEKKLIELRMLQQQATQVKQQLEMAQEQQASIDFTEQSVKGISELEDGAELQVPIANGVFIKTIYQKEKKVLVNVGANVIVDRTADDAVKLIQEQAKHMTQLQTKMQTHLQSLMERITSIEMEMTAK